MTGDMVGLAKLEVGGVLRIDFLILWWEPVLDPELRPDGPTADQLVGVRDMLGVVVVLTASDVGVLVTDSAEEAVKVRV